MVNLPPDSDERRRRDHILDFDELLAVVLALLGIGAILWWGMSRDRGFLADTSLFGPVLEGETRRTEIDDLEPSTGLFEPRTSEDGRIDPAASQPDLANQTGVPGVSGDTQITTPPTTAVVPPPVVPNPSTAEVVPQTTQPLDISDVPTDHWAYPFIKSMYDQGYLPDFPSGQFQPDQVLTRAELAALLDRTFSDAPAAQPPLSFSDVPDTYWAADAIDQAVATGFMSGYPDNSFAPDRSVPRYEVMVAIATGLKLPPSTTPDATLQSFVDSTAMPAWSQSKIAATAEQGLIVNYPNLDRLRPNQAATRAEIVAFLHQALVSQGKLPPVNSEYAVPAL